MEIQVESKGRAKLRSSLEVYISWSFRVSLGYVKLVKIDTF